MSDYDPWSAFETDNEQEDDDLDDPDDLDDADNLEGSNHGRQLERIKPPYRLAVEGMVVTHYKHPVRLPVVADRSQWGRAKINFGQRYLNQLRFYDPSSRKFRNFERELDGDVKRGASMELADDGRLMMQMGIRRGPQLTGEQVSRGVLFYDRKSPHWSDRHVTEDFYPSLVHPYVAQSQASNPFDWAFERASIANGFTVVMGLSHDCPPAHMEYPYLKLAPRMFNTTPQSLIPERVIVLDSVGREFFHGIQAVLGDCCLPETMWFLLMHREDFSLEMIASAPIYDFLKNIPLCLENGLIIDRLDQLFQMQRSMGDLPQSALSTSLELVVSVYGGENRPWWFREDIDFSSVCHGDIDRQTLLRLARSAGFAFQYAVSLYREAGDILHELEGVSHEEFIDFLGFVASTYGIGNTPRAKNILTFARQYLQCLPPSQRPSALASFQEHLQRERPTSEIIGKMEGEDASFHFPGIMELMDSQLGRNFLERERMDSLAIQVPHLLALAMPLARPLLERAVTSPTLDATNNHRLLAASSSSRLQLPVADEYQLANRIDPLCGIFAFYQQMIDECGSIDERAAKVYFAFIAPKMPDPFAPPKGFLRYFQAYSRITDPEYDQIAELTFSWLPGVVEAREKNYDVVVNKYLTIANLVDAWIMGIITQKRLLEILAWVTSKPSEDTDHRDRERERYAQLQFAHGVICIANIFVTLGILQPEDLHVVLNQDISTLCASLPRPDLFDGKGSQLGNFMKQFGALRKMGMIDSAAFRDHFLRIPQPLDRILALMRLLDESARVPGTVAAIHEAESRIFSEQVSEKDIHHFDVFLDRVTGQLEAKCLAIWRDSPFVTPESVRAYIAQHFDPQRLAALAVSLRQLRSQISDSSPRFRDPDSDTDHANAVADWKQSVSHTTAMVGGFVSLVMSMDDTDIGAADSFDCVTPLDSSGSDAMKLIERSFFALPVSPVTALQRTSSTSLMRVFSDRLSQAQPRARELIHQARRESIGLVPVGGKIQVLHAIDSERFERFRDLLGLSQTCFRLIHAGSSLILPPTPSASELKAVIHMLRLTGVLDTEYPEIQISAPGRLTPRNVAIRSSAVMFASTKCIEYDRKAFSTTHDHATGARKCAYDAGGPSVMLPFMSKLVGRTDSLGHVSEDDVDLVQLLHTVLVQGQVKQGPFADLSAVFSDRYLAILQKYGLEKILDGSWIYLPSDIRSDNNASDTHYFLVKRCTDAYFACSDRYRETGFEQGIIFDVRRLFDWLRAEVKQRQEAIYLSGKPCQEVRILLEF